MRVYFLYKNQLYKNSEPQNRSTLKNNLRTNRGSKRFPTKKIEYLAKNQYKNKNKLRTFEPYRASIIKNIEPRTTFSGSYIKNSVVEFGRFDYVRSTLRITV